MIKRILSAVFLCVAVLVWSIQSAQAISFADYVYHNIQRGNVSQVKSYLVRGYNIDAVNPNGMSALCIAVERRDARTYQQLLRLGASPRHYCMNKVDVSKLNEEPVQRIVATEEKSTIVKRQPNHVFKPDSTNYTPYIAAGMLVAGATAAVAFSSGGGSGHHGPEKTCPIGQKLVDGECQDIVCPTGSHLVGNTCVEDEHNCGVDEYWDGTECVALDCPDGMHLVGSECVPIDSCPTGQKMEDGVCVDIVCEKGYHLVGDGCVADSDCPTGQRKESGVCVDIICPENTHLSGNNCVADDDINIGHTGDGNLYGIYSDAESVFNLLSTPSYPDSQSSILLQNKGNGDVYGMYGYGGEVFNSYVVGYNWNGGINKIPVGTGNITISDEGHGTVYGMYSHIANVKQYKEAINATGERNGTAYGNITINHTGGGTTYGLMGDVRAYNTYANYGGNAFGDITIHGDGDIYGIYGYVAATNGLSPFHGNYARGIINLFSEGDGDIYGMKISKDDIPGAGSRDGRLASWFAFNAYAGGGSVDGTINIHNAGSGTSYGMYGGQQLYNAMSYGGVDEQGNPTSRATGRINLYNYGSGNAYGMYLPTTDGSGIIANVSHNNSVSLINIAHASDGVATGMRGGEGTTIINSGQININNVGDGTAVGIYAESGSEVTNEGLINIYRQNFTDTTDDEEWSFNPSETGGTAYGIYAESGVTVKNSGAISITGAENGFGVYLESGATLENTGTITFNGAEDNIKENGSVIDIYNEGRNVTAVDFSSFGGGEVILGQGGKFYADMLSGNMSISEKTVLGSFDDEYTLRSALIAEDVSSLDPISKSIMFKASTQQSSSDGYDVVLKRQGFDTLLKNKNVAAFLENNYALGHNSVLYDHLKTAQTIAAINQMSESYTGNDVLPGFRRENALIYNQMNRQFSDNLFNHQDEKYIGGYKYIDISRDKDGALVGNDGTAHTAYGMIKNRTNGGVTYGVGATVSQLKSDYDNDSVRKSNIFGLWIPVGYDFNNTKWFSKLYAGYEDGSYDRKTNLSKYSSDIEAYQYGLTNEIRHNVALGGGVYLTPAAELNLLGIYQKGFDEGHRVGSIHTDDTNMLSLEGGLGTYLTKDFQFNENNKLGIQIGGIYYVEFLDPDEGIDASIKGMSGKYKIAHKSDDSHAVFSARINYNYKNMTLYGLIEQETGGAKALVIDAGLQYNL